MLVLRRKEGQSISIGDNIEIKIFNIKDGSAEVGISAPKEIPIRRDDIKNVAIRTIKSTQS